MKSTFVVMAAVLLLIGTAHAEPTIWYVHPDSVLNSIQAALDSCVDNDIVLVGLGTYYENIVWPNTQGIHLISEHGIEVTIIDGDSVGSVIKITTGVDTTTIVKGFTIQHGRAWGGGGISCRDNSSPSIENVNISRNAAEDYGGGIHCRNSSPSLANVIIGENIAAYRGGGIYCEDNSSPSIESVTICGNATEYYGGGIYCQENSSPSLANVIISENTAVFRGGGISCLNSSPSIESVTICGNAAEYGGGIYCRNSSPSLANVIISENTAGFGGGVYCKNHSSPSLTNVTISGSIAFCDGGGIDCEGNSSPSLTNVTMSGNTASWSGGGISCLNSSPSLENVNISRNTADSYGGGICCRENSSPSLANVIISENTVDYRGGGIGCRYNSSPSLENVTMCGNTAGYDGGGICCENHSSPSLVNCIQWNDTPNEIFSTGGSVVTATYSDIQGGWLGAGNIDTNPMFMDGPLSDYHLSLSSPCIDTGNPDPQYNDPEDPLNPGYALWPALGTVRNDMGVYGGPNASGWASVEEHKLQQPMATVLQVKPNPFSNTVVIRYETKDENCREISLSIYDITGRLVKSFGSLHYTPSPIAIMWDGTDKANRRLPSGVYFLKLRAEDYSTTEKLLLIR